MQNFYLNGSIIIACKLLVIKVTLSQALNQLLMYLQRLTGILVLTIYQKNVLVLIDYKLISDDLMSRIRDKAIQKLSVLAYICSIIQSDQK